MKSFDESPEGTRVWWKPTKPQGSTYTGTVVAHNPRGKDIYSIPQYLKNAAGKPKPCVDFDRVVVKADHDGKWHAQDLKGLCTLR